MLGRRIWRPLELAVAGSIWQRDVYLSDLDLVSSPAASSATGTYCSHRLLPRVRVATLAAYCAGFIEIDPISRVSLVTQLICRSYPLGVPVWKLL
jgi:hypothetical protein